MIRSFSISATGSDRSGRRATLIIALAGLCLAPAVQGAGGAPAANGAPNAPAAAASVELQKDLALIGKGVEQFWNDISAVACSEKIEQTKLDGKGKVIFDSRSEYDYLMLLQLSGGDISVEESRIEKGQKHVKGNAPFLITNGFSVLSLIFHPQYQSSYEFRKQFDDAEKLEKISFHHVHGARSPSVLVLKDREYPLEWAGTAWIKPDTRAIVRIEAQLSNPMEEVGLLRLDAKVRYAPVQFSGVASSSWLPESATVEAATRRQHWRNTHQFVDYRRFNVEAQVKPASGQ